MLKDFPFSVIDVGPGLEIRKFSADLEEEELSWHRDREDRIVLLVSGEGWMVQLDDEKPKMLTCERGHSIPAGIWHRLFKLPSATDLVVKIFKCV